MRQSKTGLQGINFDVKLEDEQLKKLQGTVYILAGALVLSAIIISRGKKSKN